MLSSCRLEAAFRRQGIWNGTREQLQHPGLVRDAV